MRARVPGRGDHARGRAAREVAALRAHQRSLQRGDRRCRRARRGAGRVTKDYYMACLDLAGRRCVVVGGGSVGVEKVRGLLATGARVTVVAPEVAPQLHELDVVWRPRRYRERDLAGAFLVVAATEDRRGHE